MAVLERAATKPKFVDKEWVRKKLAEHDALTGFVPMQGITAQMVRDMVSEDLSRFGIVPEDRFGSTGIIKMREE